MKKLLIYVNLDGCAAAGTYWYMQGGVRTKKGSVRNSKGDICNNARHVADALVVGNAWVVREGGRR